MIPLSKFVVFFFWKIPSRSNLSLVTSTFITYTGVGDMRVKFHKRIILPRPKETSFIRPYKLQTFFPCTSTMIIHMGESERVEMCSNVGTFTGNKNSYHTVINKATRIIKILTGES